MRIGQNLQYLGYFIVGVVLLGSLWGASVVGAATYYVATTGNDANPGTEALPFRTMSKGVKGLKPGDTLYVKNGTYAEALINKIPGGTSWSSPVTVAAYPGHTVTLRPPAGGYFVLQFAASSKQYIVVEGFILDAGNGQYQAIKITHGSSTGASHHIRIIDCEIKNARYSGILITTGSDNNEFINLNVHDNGTTDFDHGFYVSSSNNLFEKSLVYRNAGWGFHVYSQGHSGVANNNIIRNNKIYQNARVGGRGPGIILSSGNGNMAYNNLIWGNKGGIQVDFNSVSDTKIYNNTVYANGKFGISIGAASRGASVRNNIVYGNSGPPISNAGSGTLLSDNLVNVDPKFMNAAANDFRLQAGSPAISTGVTLSEVPMDYAGVPRPQGGRYDIGGFEYTGSTSGTPVGTPMNLRIVDP